jgi:TP901 family phage tail tape measure protein
MAGKAPIASLIVQLRADSKGFVTGLGKAEKQLSRFDRKAFNSGKGVRAFENGLKSMIGAAGLAGLGVALGKVTRDYAEFEKQITEIQTLGVAASFKEIAGSVRTLSNEFGISKAQQAKAFYDTISSGAKTAGDAVKILDVTNKLAIAGVADLASTTKLVNTFLNSFGLEASQADKVADSLFATVKNGVTTIPELGDRLGNVASLAAAAGVSFTDLNAAVGAATKNGQSTAIAVTGIQQAIANIIKPSKEAADTAAQLGIEFDSAALKSEGLAEFLLRVEEATGGNAEAMTRLFGSVEAYRTVAAVTANQGAALRVNLEGQAAAAGEFADEAERLNNTLSNQGGRLLENLSSLTGTLFQGASDAVDLAGDIREINDELTELNRIIRDYGVLGGIRAVVFGQDLSIKATPLPSLPFVDGQVGPFAPGVESSGVSLDNSPFIGEEAAGRARRSLAAGRRLNAPTSPGGGGGGGTSRRRRPDQRNRGIVRLTSQEYTDPTSAVGTDPIFKIEKDAEQVFDRIGQSAKQLQQDLLLSISSGIGGGISNAITQAQSLEEAFENIARTVGGRVVGALVEFGLQMLLLEGISKAATAGSVAATAAAASAQTAALQAPIQGLAASWAPAATAASIATLGGASGIGLAAYLSALAAGTAATVAQQAVTGATGALFGAIGQSHGGIDSVPRDGTWYLQKGERVVRREENRELTDFMRRGQTVNVHNYTGASVSARRGPNGIDVIIEAVADEMLSQSKTGRGKFARAGRYMNRG